MARKQALQIVISGDTAQLNRAFAKADKDLGRFGNNAEKTSKRFSGSMKVAGAAVAGALGVGLKQSVSAAVEAEKSQARLTAQLKASGISYKAHAAAIEESINATSRLSGLDDEDLADSFTNIVRVTGNVNKSLKLTGLAADFARAKHVEVAKAGELVGKVAGGNTGVLGRYGIQLRKGATATEALAVMQKKFGGQAEAYGKTSAGAADRAAVGWENLQEVVGRRLAPAMAKVANKLADVANWAQRNPKAFKAMAIAAGTLATAMAGVLIVTKVAAALKTMRTAIIAVNLAMATNPVVAITAAIAALGLALVVAYKKSATFRKVVDTAFKAVREVAAQAFEVMTLGTRAFLKGIEKVAGAASKLPGMGWLKSVARAAKRGGDEIAQLADKIRGVKSPKPIKVRIETVINGVKGTIEGDITKPLRKTPPPIRRGAGDVADGFNDVPAAAGGLAPAAARGLSQIRSLFGGVRVNSGRRSVEENRRVGGAPNSDHLSGLALDLEPAGGWSPAGVRLMDRIAAWARRRPNIRWIGWRGVPGHGPGDHLHLSFKPSGGGARGPARRGAGDVVDKLQAFGGKVRGIGDVVGKFVATSYGPPWGGINGGGVTANGTNLKGAPKIYGIAADPRVLPMGKRVKINPNPFGYSGAFRVFDTGGAIKGNRIDFYDWRGRKAQMSWGKKTVTVSTADDKAGGGGGGSSAPKVDVGAARERAGSRIVNQLVSKYGGGKQGFRRATKLADIRARVIEDKDTAYGQLEREFGQSEEDLGTAAGRTKRMSEIDALKAEKAKQLARQKKRAELLRKAIGRYEKLLKAGRRARDKARGAKRAKINERLKTYDDKLTDLKAELRTLGVAIRDTELDIGDLTKEAGEVAATPDTAGDDAPSATDKAGSDLELVDLRERAGVYSPEQASAERQRILTAALNGAYGSLNERQRLQLQGDLLDVQRAQVEAATALASELTALREEIAKSNAIAESTLGISLREAQRAFADMLSNELGGRVAARTVLPDGHKIARY